MPRFKTEEGKQRWLASMAAMRGRPRKKQPDELRENGSVPTKTVRSGGGIAGAIEEIESRIAVLEQVKRQLMQAQELVNG